MGGEQLVAYCEANVKLFGVEPSPCSAKHAHKGLGYIHGQIH